MSETCEFLSKQAENLQFELQNELSENEIVQSNSNIGKSWTVRRSWKKSKEIPKKSSKFEEQINGTTESDEQSSAESVPIDKPKKSIGYNFIAEDFGGITLRRTKCLECESITEIKEKFYDICVPIPLDIEFDCTPSEFYRSYCVTSENLRDTNKYWCETCGR